MRYRAVIFDVGGVVVGSPLHAIARYERDKNILAGAINRVIVPRIRFLYASTISLNAAPSPFCARLISSKSTSMPYRRERHAKGPIASIG